MAWEYLRGYDEVMSSFSRVTKEYHGTELENYDKTNVHVTFLANGKNLWYDEYTEGGQTVNLKREYIITNNGMLDFQIGQYIPTGFHVIRSCAYFSSFKEDILRESNWYDFSCAVKIAYVTEDNDIHYESIPNIETRYIETIQRYHAEWIDGILTAVPGDPSQYDEYKNAFDLFGTYAYTTENLDSAIVNGTISLPLFKNEDDAINYLLTGEGEPITPTPEPEPETEEEMKTYFIECHCYKSLDGTKGEKQLVYHHFQSFKVNKSCEMVRYDLVDSATEPLTQYWKYRNLNTASTGEYAFKGKQIYKEYDDSGVLIDEGSLETPLIEDMINPYNNHEELLNNYFSIINSNIPFVKDPDAWADPTPPPPKNPSGDDEPSTNMPDIYYHHVGSTVHLLNYSQLKNFMGILYTNNVSILDDILEGLKMYGENPINSVIDLYYVPFDVKPFCAYENSNYIPLGAYPAQVTNITLTQSNNKVTIVETLIGAQYGDFRDFDSTYYIYLPYVGILEFDYIKYYNQTLKIEMAYDIYTGNIKYYLFGNGLLKDMYEGSVKVSMALCGADKSSKAWDVVNGSVNFLGDAVKVGMSSGSVDSISQFAKSTISLGETMSKAPTKHISGNNSPANGVFDCQYVYLIIENPEYIKPVNLEMMYGIPDNDVNTLGSRTGYIECSDIQLKTLATETEQNEIISLLNTGVFI